MLKWIKRIAALVLLLGIASAIAWAYRPKPIVVEVATVTRGPMTVAIEAEGRTRVHDRYVVSAPVMGQLERIEWHAGDSVREGAVVARLVPSPAPLLDARTRDEADSRVNAAADSLAQARAAVDRARAAYEAARREAARQRTLVERDAAPRMAAEQADAEERLRAADLASARFASQVAGHAVETARVLAGRLRSRAGEAGAPIEITAPVSGRILRVAQQSETIVNVGAAIVEIGDPAQLEIVADVLTQDAIGIRAGARVRIDRWGGEAVLDGRVRLVEPSAFTRTSALGVDEQRVNVVVDLTTPPDAWRSLGDGFRVEAAIETWADTDVLRVPSGAVFRDRERWAVFTIDVNRAHRRVVETGRRDGRDVQVLHGLEPGERVILHPGDTIREGIEVAAR